MPKQTLIHLGLYCVSLDLLCAITAINLHILTLFLYISCMTPCGSPQRLVGRAHEQPCFPGNCVHLHCSGGVKGDSIVAFSEFTE